MPAVRFTWLAGAALATLGLGCAPSPKPAQPTAMPRPHAAIATPKCDGVFSPCGIFGANIHFTDARPGELEMLAASGIQILRMDLTWSNTERERKRYDFSAYDRLVERTSKLGLRLILILDYGNPLYGDPDFPFTPRTAEARTAMAHWAAQAVQHFAGRGILWEMYNEPNHRGFWKPEPNVADYVALAKEVLGAVRAIAPHETLIGPATSGIDLSFLEACFRGGLLDYWDAVSVHPYRQSAPETVAADYRQLRALIGRYAPKGKTLPIVSGEWGYSTAWKDYDDGVQAKYLVRQWLTNLENDVRVSIWYDWHDDGADPKDSESNFGLVGFAYHDGRTPPYDEKPAYRAAKTFFEQLQGRPLVGRLFTNSAEAHALLFGGSPPRLVAWTTHPLASTPALPASAGSFSARTYTGTPMSDFPATYDGLPFTLLDAPAYLTPRGENALLEVATHWELSPQVVARAPARLEVETTIGNPLGRDVQAELSAGLSRSVVDSDERGVLVQRTGRFAKQRLSLPAGTRRTAKLALDVDRGDDDVPLTVNLLIVGVGSVSRQTRLSVGNPLRVETLPPTGDYLVARIDDPSGDRLAARLEVELTTRVDPKPPVVQLQGQGGHDASLIGVPVDLPSGSTQSIIVVPVRESLSRVALAWRLIDPHAGKPLLVTRGDHIALVDGFFPAPSDATLHAWRVAADGDPKVSSEQTLALIDNPEPAPYLPARVVELRYRFSDGWKFLQVLPSSSLGSFQKPREIGMWIWSDGTGNIPRIRLRDASGQTFQPSASPLSTRGWRYVTFTLEEPNIGHWGGANDGVVHEPLSWEALFLLDSARSRFEPSHVLFASPMLVF